MEELIKRITEQTGISADQARSAINLVSGYLKQKLPAPIATQVDHFLSGGAGDTSSASDTLGNAASKIGSIFGSS